MCRISQFGGLKFWLDSVPLYLNLLLSEWEEALCEGFSTKETSLESLFDIAQKVEGEYSSILATFVHASACDYRDDYIQAEATLKRIISIYANIVKLHPKSAMAHFRFGMFLEEELLFREIYEPAATHAHEAGGNISKLEGADDDDDDCPLFDDLPDGTFDQGSSVNKEDDIRAICVLHSVPKNAPIGQVLKALDTEYQQMREIGNFEKAEYVQGLYSWKSRQAKSIQTIASQQAKKDPEGPFARAAVKYLDACSIDSMSKECDPISPTASVNN